MAAQGGAYNKDNTTTSQRSRGGRRTIQRRHSTEMGGVRAGPPLRSSRHWAQQLLPLNTAAIPAALCGPRALMALLNAALTC
jgi:hypothetical protein